MSLRDGFSGLLEFLHLGKQVGIHINETQVLMPCCFIFNLKTVFTLKSVEAAATVFF